MAKIRKNETYSLDLDADEARWLVAALQNPAGFLQCPKCKHTLASSDEDSRDAEMREKLFTALTEKM